MKLTDILNEYQINQPNSKRPPALIEVVKDWYYCIETANEGNYYTKEEIGDFFFHTLIVGDVWELQKDEDEEGKPYYKCIKGRFEGEQSDETGWEYDDNTKDFFKILKR
jgi:hypothetical protein